MKNGLKVLRAELGMTQMELANELKLSFSTINRWENGKSIPNKSTFEYLKKYALEHNVSNICLDALEDSFFINSIDKNIQLDSSLISNLIDDSNDCIYVADCKTDELLYLNKAAKKVLNITDYAGQKCYSCILGSSKPCEFCHKELLSKDCFDSHKVEFKPLNKTYNIKGKLINWCGRQAHVHYITEEQEESVLTKIGCAVCIYFINKDKSLEFKYANNAYVELCEGSLESVCSAYNKNHLFAVADEFKDIVFNYFKRIIKTRVSSELTYRCVTLKGNSKWITLKASFINGDEALRDRLYCTFIDITNDIEDEEQITNLVDNVPGAMIVLKAKSGKIQLDFISSAIKGITGYTSDELYAHFNEKNIFDINAVEFFYNIDWFDVSKNKKLSHTFQIKCRNNSKKWVHVQLSQVIGANSSIAYYGVLSDVDEEQSNNIVRDNLIEALPGGLGIYKFSDKIELIYYNQGLVDLFYGQDTKSDKKEINLSNITNFEDYVFEGDRNEFFTTMNAAVQERKPFSITFRVQINNKGFRWVQVAANFIREDDGSPVYCFIYTTPNDEMLLFKETVDGSANGVIVIERKTNQILYINKACLELHGYNGVQTSKVIGHEIPDGHNLLDQDQYSSFNYNNYSEIHIIRRNQQRLLIKGKLIRWCGHDSYIFYIIDETKEYVEHSKIASLLNSVPAGIVIIDIVNGRALATYINEGFYNIIQAQKEDKVDVENGYDIIKSISDEDKPRIQELIQKVINGLNDYNITYKHLVNENTVVWLNMTGHIVSRTKEGIRVYCGFTNVSDLVDIQIDLTRNKNLLNAAMNSVKLDAWRLDVKNRSIVFSDNMVNNKLGNALKIEDIPDSLLKNGFIHPSCAQKTKDFYKKVFNGERVSAELKIKQKTNNVYEWERITYIPIFDNDGNLIESIGSGLNITDEVLKKQLEKSLDSANKANKAKSDFLSRMSHDMRTPMNGILGLANLMKNSNDITEIKNDLTQLEESGNYLLRLINDTLDMNKIEAGKLELHTKPIDGNAIFKNVISNASILAERKNVQLLVDAQHANERKMVTVLADASRLQQVLMNIISNAIKFTPPGGKVTLKMQNLKMTNDEIVDRYTISDTGIGMSKEFLQNAFEPFSQESRINTDRESSTGLGLAIVKELVDLMGGKISIESEVNKGTTVIIELSYEVYHGKLENDTQLSDMSVLEGKRVLLCEDHPVNSMIARRLLTSKQMIVESAVDGQIGVEMFEKSPINYYDIVLMDIRMPRMTGLEAVKIIRALNRADATTVPIIAMTANAYIEDVQKSIEAGMNKHLAKPIDPEELYKTLVSFLKKQ